MMVSAGYRALNGFPIAVELGSLPLSIEFRAMAARDVSAFFVADYFEVLRHICTVRNGYVVVSLWFNNRRGLFKQFEKNPKGSEGFTQG